jgi:hypothetical protein
MGLTIYVDLTNDVTLNANYQAVLNATSRIISKLFKWSPPAGERPVHVYYYPDEPLTDSTSDTSVYKIRLNIVSARYDQMIFQFSHEMCHVYTDPRRSNWFIESCCELISQVMLDKMSEIWVQIRFKPDIYRDERDKYRDKFLYAQKIRAYAKNHIQKKYQEANLSINLIRLPEKLEWLRGVSTGLSTNPIDRPRNAVIATMMRPIFEKQTDGWDALQFLGKSCMPPTTTDLKDLITNSGFSFDMWLGAVPDHLKGLVRDIME